MNLHLSDEELQSLIDHAPEVDMRRAEEHLAACPECRRRAEEYRRLFALLAAAPQPALSTGFARKTARKALRGDFGELQISLTQIFFISAACVLAAVFLADSIAVVPFIDAYKAAAAAARQIAGIIRSTAFSFSASFSVLALPAGVLLLLLWFDHRFLRPRFRSSSSL